MPADNVEKQVTSQPGGHVLTNAGVWSPDGSWVVYDVRSDPAGSRFDGDRIERVNVETGEIQILYTAKNQACVGVATCSPVDDRVVFIHGPEFPTPEWSYNAWHRQGVIVRCDCRGEARNLDARDLVSPYTPGALRGGSHLHLFDGAGQWVAFTYEDAILAEASERVPHRDLNQRNVGVSVPICPVHVPRRHSRNHDGTHFSVLITTTISTPQPGSDEICRACEEAWIGDAGYVRSDGSRQRRALAFQGRVVGRDGRATDEVFVLDVPDDVTIPGDGPLEGTLARRPAPPKGTAQRRLTYTTDRPYPGIQGPRHWLRSSPDGNRIAFFMKDADGVVQIWTVSPRGGEPSQLSHHSWNIASAFTWSPDGHFIAHVMDNSIFVTDATTGAARRLTARTTDERSPRPEACVFAPDGSQIAYVKPVAKDGSINNQVFTVTVPSNA